MGGSSTTDLENCGARIMRSSGLPCTVDWFELCIQDDFISTGFAKNSIQNRTVLVFRLKFSWRARGIRPISGSVILESGTVLIAELSLSALVKYSRELRLKHGYDEIVPLPERRSDYDVRRQLAYSFPVEKLMTRT